jgi:hypothetical protein
MAADEALAQATESASAEKTSKNLKLIYFPFSELYRNYN